MSLFCLGCVESLPLPKGTEIFLFQVILLFAFVSVFYPLFEFFFFVPSFSFSFSLMVTKCVCCQCTHQGGGGGPMWFRTDDGHC
jgi:hypothetical protein